MKPVLPDTRRVEPSAATATPSTRRARVLSSEADANRAVAVTSAAPGVNARTGLRASAPAERSAPSSSQSAKT